MKSLSDYSSENYWEVLSVQDDSNFESVDEILQFSIRMRSTFL